MKEKKLVKRIVAALFAIVIFFIAYGDFQVFAETYNCYITVHTSGSSQCSGKIAYSVDNTTYTDVYSVSFTGGQSNNKPFTLDVPGFYRFYTYSVSSSYRYYISYVKFNNNSNLTFEYNSSLTMYEVNVDDNFQVLLYGYRRPSTYENNYIYIHVLPNTTPTPDPTPTPTPAPTPTPLPVDYDDTQFWGRINTMAEGGWSALTVAFNGIFNNTVLRNLVVYVPLFGAIIYLFVYLLFMGSD